MRSTCARLPRLHGSVRSARERPERRGILQGQDHQSGDRLFGRRRLRPLRPASRPPHGQAHSRQPGDRAAEHGGRGQPARGELHLHRGAEGRHGVRHLRPHHRHQSAAGKRRDLRRHQVLLDRQRHRRREPVRHLAHPAGEDLEGLPGEADRRSAARGRARSRTFSRASTRTCSARRSSLSPAIPAPTRSRWRWSAARSTGCAACRGARSRRATRNGSRTRRSTCIVQASFKKVPEIGDVPLVMEQTKDTEKLQILKLILGGAGDGAAVRGAARHSGRPQGRAGRGVRRHHEGPGVSWPTPRSSTSTSIRSAARRWRICWRSFTPRRRTW